MGKAVLTKPRLYVEAALVYNVSIALSSAQAHYLGVVLRRQGGDEVRLFNGRDGEWLATITLLAHDSANVRITMALRPQCPELNVTILCAVLKREALEFVVQKATELGVTRLQPILMERSQRQPINAARLTAIAIEAAEQSERLTVPQLAPATPLQALLETWPVDRQLAVAVERSGNVFTRVRADALLVGPEGGFSQRELDATMSHPFVLPMCLGPSVLRAETAAIAGLTLLLAERPPCAGC